MAAVCEAQPLLLLSDGLLCVVWLLVDQLLEKSRYTSTKCASAGCCRRDSMAWVMPRTQNYGQAQKMRYANAT